jgi:hypothetical protein
MSSIAALAIAVALGTAGESGARSLVGPLRSPDLAVRLVAVASHDSGVASPVAPAVSADAPPPCKGDVCQPVVSVPGFEPRYERVHRSELFVAALDRAHVEPFASLAWGFVRTGLRVDWSPSAADSSNAGAGGWGSVMLRLRLRLDATNHLVFPQRSARRG